MSISFEKQKRYLNFHGSRVSSRFFYIGDPLKTKAKFQKNKIFFITYQKVKCHNSCTFQRPINLSRIKKSYSIFMVLRFHHVFYIGDPRKLSQNFF